MQVAHKSASRKRPKGLQASHSDPLHTLSSKEKEASRGSESGLNKPKLRKRLDEVPSEDEETWPAKIKPGKHPLTDVSDEDSPIKRVLRKRPRFSGAMTSDDDEILLSASSDTQRKTRIRRRSAPQESRKDTASDADEPEFLFDDTDSDSDVHKLRTPSPVRDYDDEIDRIAQASNDRNGSPREVPRCFPSKKRGSNYYRASEIPTQLIDMINATPEWEKARNAPVIRKMFEAMIATNTAEEEFQAPSIRVINEVDDEPTPPWEFYYTNKIYHTNDVPAPEYATLKGCNCIGKCNPESKTCACIKRQREAYRDQIEGDAGFNYDEDGLLLYPDYPTFECNDACGCTEDCMNRVSYWGICNFLGTSVILVGRLWGEAVQLRSTLRRPKAKDGVSVFVSEVPYFLICKP